MQVLKTISFISLTLVLLSGCYYDVEEEIYPTIACLTSELSYSMDIVPILQNDCYNCHSEEANFGNVTLEGYEEILEYVNDESLLGVIKHSSGYSPMPKGGAKLLDCEIEKIEIWINDGAINN